MNLQRQSVVAEPNDIDYDLGGGNVPLKGVFEEKPTLPGYSVTWDPAILLSYLKTLSPVKELTIKMLTHKTVALLGLLSAQRCQTLYFLEIRNILINSSTVKFSVGDKLNQTKLGKHVKELEFPTYPTDTCLCVVDGMKEYLERTKPLRGDITSLFVTYAKPYKAACKHYYISVDQDHFRTCWN